MRILVISNLYPPYYIGGYELACRDVVWGLNDRGHKLAILTSTWAVSKPVTENGIYRWLHFHWFSPYPWQNKVQLGWREFKDNAALKRLCDSFQPELLYIWNMGGISKSLLMTAHSQGVPVVYAFFDRWLVEDTRRDGWLAYWEHVPSKKWKRLLKMAIKELLHRSVPTELVDVHFEYAHFFSETLKTQYVQAGYPVGNAKVIYYGVNVDQYHRCERIRDDSHIHLLYVGQVVKHKGVHTAIEAVSRLINGRGYRKVDLTIVGTGPDPDYLSYLKELVKEHRLARYVTFLGKVPRENLADIYLDHDILVFPSIWVEPLGMTILEAFACGLAVIGTATGGSAEILTNEENSLIFPADDSVALADRIQRLIKDPGLREKISAGGKMTVEERFNMKSMLDQIEEYLEQVVSGRI